MPVYERNNGLDYIDSDTLTARLSNSQRAFSGIIYYDVSQRPTGKRVNMESLSVFYFLRKNTHKNNINTHFYLISFTNTNLSHNK